MTGGFALSSESTVLLVSEDNLRNIKAIIHLLQRTFHAVKDFVRKRGPSLLPPLLEPELPFENKGCEKNQEKDLDSKQDRQIDMQSAHHAHRNFGRIDLGRRSTLVEMFHPQFFTLGQSSSDVNNKFRRRGKALIAS